MINIQIIKKDKSIKKNDFVIITAGLPFGNATMTKIPIKFIMEEKYSINEILNAVNEINEVKVNTQIKAFRKKSR